MSDSIRELRDRRESAERGERDAQRLRQLADRLGDPDSLGDGPGELDAPLEFNDRPTTRSFTQEPVDARPPPGQAGVDEDQAGRTIAEWLGEPGEGLGDGGAGAPDELAEGVRSAQRGAQRAVDDRAVPKRYEELIRRVYERYGQRVSPPAQPATPAPDAPDAGG